MFIEFTTFTSKPVTLRHMTQSGGGGSSISSRSGIMAAFSGNDRQVASWQGECICVITATAAVL